MKKKILIFDDENLNLKKTIAIIFLVMVICGIIGFIYETIFYKIDLGYFVKRGSTFGPWIPIYAVGGFLIVVTTYRLRKYPLAVFLVNCLVTGVLEYLTGMALFEIWHIRLWDYNTEIWNYGNINGYICLRSVLCFGLSSLGLIYFIVPKVKNVAMKMEENKFMIISFGLSALFLLDVILHAIIK